MVVRDVALYVAPVARTAYVRPRLQLAGTSDTNSALHPNWLAIEAAARSAWMQLRADILNRVPNAEITLGKSSGGAVEMFSYCRLSLPSRDESIVVGVTVYMVEDDYHVTADLCGEDSGVLLLKQDDQVLENERSNELSDAVANVAARLARRVDEIAAVLCNGSGAE